MKTIDKTLENKVVILTQENEFYKTENSQLKEQLNWLQRQIFGKKSERTCLLSCRRNRRAKFYSL